MTALARNDAADLLLDLISLGGWRNSRNTVEEALPHVSETLTAADLCEVLTNLRIPYTQVACRLSDIAQSDCPALIFPARSKAVIATGRKGKKIALAGGDMRDATRQRCILVRIDRFQYRARKEDARTVLDCFADLKPMLPWLLAASLLTNLLGLLAPLMIMAIYDRVIPSGSVDLLLSLGIGAAIILATDFFIRHIRTKALAHVGQAGERALTVALFRKLMALPLPQLQKTDADQQLSRFRQFEALREVFTGQVMTGLLDLPFALIFIAVLIALAPPVGLMTLGFAGLLLVLGLATVPAQMRRDKSAAEAGAAARTLVQDAILHQRAISGLGLQDRFATRAEPLVEAAELATQRARRFQNTIASLAQTITVFATVCAIAVSTAGAINGTMTFGALIAVIALVSKILAPIHALHANLPQILAFRDSRAQADRVLALPQELELGLEQAHQKTLSGAFKFNGVTHRPDPLVAPLLSQVSFSVEPGECVVLMGSDVAARTAVLDLLEGFQAPLSGSIECDGIDIRQIARDELRNSITYAASQADLFYGTIEQNIRLAAPLASASEIARTLEAMHLGADIDLLPDGVQTRLSDGVLSAMPKETVNSLALARAMSRPAPILLLADPTSGLGQRRRDAFRGWLTSERSAATVLVSTADWSFIDIADRCLFLQDGRLVVNDTGADGRKKLRAVLRNLEGRQ